MVSALVFFSVLDGAPVKERVGAPQLPVGYERFHAKGIALSKYVGSDMAFSFSAGEIYQRKRVSKLFVYENLKELFLSGVRLEIHAGAEGNGKPLIPLEDLGGSLSALESSLQPVKDAAAEDVSDEQMSLVSRVVMDTVALRIHPDRNTLIEVSANEAVISSLFDMLVMNDKVRIAAGERVITAEKAVWASGHNGFFLPAGYVENGTMHREKAFFRVDRNTLAEQVDVPAIDYTDLLDKKENEFYSGIAGNLSPIQRIAFGLPPVAAGSASSFKNMDNASRKDTFQRPSEREELKYRPVPSDNKNTSATGN